MTGLTFDSNVQVGVNLVSEVLEFRQTEGVPLVPDICNRVGHRIDIDPTSIP